MLFHAMKWQSEEHIQMSEAAEWARHFGRLEQDLDTLLCDLFGKAREQISAWAKAGKYVSGQELVTAGLAEAIPYTALIANLRQLQAEQQGLSVHKPTRTKQIAH